jgi:phosphonate transport system substrate-binding protein
VQPLTMWHALAIVFAVVAGIMSGCTSKRAELGTEKNPVKLFFVPSVDAKVIEDKSKLIKTELEKRTGYKFEVSMPANFIAVVEAFGTKRADVAAINTFGYILASEKYGAEAGLTVVRFGDSTYSGQIVARSDSDIKSVKDLDGKKIAYVDPASTSGYLLPAKLFKDNNIKPKETVFAQKHDNVISMVYQKQVDAGATFHSPVENGEIQDARRLVKKQYPDVEDKVKIIQLTDAIPNDPIVFRKELTPEMKAKITDAIMGMMETPEGKDAFFSIYGVTAFKKATDADYGKVKEMLTSLGVKVQELVK